MTEKILVINFIFKFDYFTEQQNSAFLLIGLFAGIKDEADENELEKLCSLEHNFFSMAGGTIYYAVASTMTAKGNKMAFVSLQKREIFRRL